MSASASHPGKTIIERFSLIQSALTLALAVGGTLLTVGMFQGGLTSRLTSLESATQKNEQSIERNRAEREQLLREKLDVKVYEADKQIWLDVKKTVEEIRKDQLNDLRERAKGQPQQ